MTDAFEDLNIDPTIQSFERRARAFRRTLERLLKLPDLQGRIVVREDTLYEYIAALDELNLWSSRLNEEFDEFFEKHFSAISEDPSREDCTDYILYKIHLAEKKIKESLTAIENQYARIQLIIYLPSDIYLSEKECNLLNMVDEKIKQLKGIVSERYIGMSGAGLIPTFITVTFEG